MWQKQSDMLANAERLAKQYGIDRIDGEQDEDFIFRVYAQHMSIEVDKKWKAQNTPTEPLSFWLVFLDDRGDREDCNVFYSDLVVAPTGRGAIIAALRSNPHLTQQDIDDYLADNRYDARLMKPICPPGVTVVLSTT